VAVDHDAVLLALRARVLTLGTLPAARAWTNKDFTPTSGVPYVEEDYVPATSSLIAGPASGGLVEDTGVYVIKWYGLANTGLQVLSSANALLALFSPGFALTASDGTTVRLRGDSAPSLGQVLPVSGGWAVCPVTVPFRIHTTNPA
jgi:hypothetical protein